MRQLFKDVIKEPKFFIEESKSKIRLIEKHLKLSKDEYQKLKEEFDNYHLRFHDEAIDMNLDYEAAA